LTARDLGIEIGRGRPGPLNAITDVAGVRVGHCTIISGDGPLVPGRGPVRTGVTVLDPGGELDIWARPMLAGFHTMNGCGEVTGLHWLRESGTLGSPIGLTSTHSVGAVHEGLIEQRLRRVADPTGFAALPIVAETNDARLSDNAGFHVRPHHVSVATEALSEGRPAEGSVGGGTGIVCHRFKAGIGTASRRVQVAGRQCTVGVLVQANYGRRERLTVNGAPIGPLLDVPLPGPGLDAGLGDGSIIVVAATDAPLLPSQCAALAQRACFGVVRTGGAGEYSSGDFALAFSTANRLTSTQGLIDPPTGIVHLDTISDAQLNPLYWAVIEATEEAIVNSLVAASTMTGRDGITVHALPHDQLIAVLEHFRLRSLAGNSAH
jgi:D-aminopeptidase